MLDKRARWIWRAEDAKPEEYVSFRDSFEYAGGEAMLLVAAETDYIAYINGVAVSFGQLPGYPFEKYYDEIDVSGYCRSGVNELSVTVRYEGAVGTATHIEDGAGLIYRVTLGGECVAYSRQGIECGYDGRYIQRRERRISPQLGYSSGMSVGDPDYSERAVEVTKTYNLKPRPVAKTVPVGRQTATHVGRGIYDLGRESAGYLYLRVRSPRDCEFKIAYGEHLEDGEVRRIIGNRDFSLDFSVKAGEWELRQYFLRIAGRYLQLISEGDVELLEIGVEQYLYPLTEIPRELAPEDRRIYDTCIRTLRLSMNHHYEDCPWREQALYVLDGRNQMLCGYYAFRERSFQRENLLMMSKGVREDGFLELTFPAKDTPSIPFFSIMYAVAVEEYVRHTGDLTILDEVMPRIERIMKSTADRIDRNGLIGDFDPPYWNFYEWIDGSDGYPIGNNGIPDRLKYHLILNCAFVYAGEHYRRLCALRGIDCDLDTDSVRRAIEQTFLDGDTGLFRNRPEGEDRSQLGNAFALLIGLGDERTVRAVKDSSGLAPATLSMIGYVYDALLNADPVSNKDFVLRDIRRRYNAMLDKGATTFWETEEGASAFDGAGSLCHGWSAMPVYYYWICCD